MKSYILYYKDDIALTHLKFYRTPKFRPKKGGSGKYKDVPQERMHYFPLVPRLKRLYILMNSPPYIWWHRENKRNDGVITHYSHGKA